MDQSDGMMLMAYETMQTWILVEVALRRFPDAGHLRFPAPAPEGHFGEVEPDGFSDRSHNSGPLNPTHETNAEALDYPPQTGTTKYVTSRQSGVVAL